MQTHIALRSTIVALTLSAAALASSSRASEESKEKPKTREVKIESLTLTVPESWKQTEPANKLRKAQFEVPAAEGEKEPVELVVFSFPGGGGGIEANIRRWIGQFEPKGRNARVVQGKSPQGPYIVADVTGTYNEPIGPPIRQQTRALPDARMLSVILAVEEAKQVYYIKLAGKEKTVSAAADDLRSAFGADKKTEEPVKLDGDDE